MNLPSKNCFLQMTNAAVRWQPEAMPVHLESDVNTESAGKEGESTVWRARFASSQSRHMAIIYLPR